MQAAAENGIARFPEVPPAFAAFAPKPGDPVRGPSVEHLEVTGKKGLAACNVGPTDETTTWTAANP